MDSKIRRRSVEVARQVSVPFEAAVEIIKRDPGLLIGSPAVSSWVASEGREQSP
jgi:hypothetical protein